MQDLEFVNVKHKREKINKRLLELLKCSECAVCVYIGDDVRACNSFLKGGLNSIFKPIAK